MRKAMHKRKTEKRRVHHKQHEKRHVAKRTSTKRKSHSTKRAGGLGGIRLPRMTG
jgi:hypothetical protein